ncbi:MAG: MBL fold metallo-hydrolase [Rikenellaceae bacterium]|nr:MBL fold metallo-hydrolase [Rikenellaceae bacterium]
MINLALLTFNSFQENTYILSDETGECIIVDPGNNNEKENSKISAYIEKNNLKPVMIVNTHGHVDHLLGVDYLKEKYSIPFALHSKDKFLVETAPMQGRMYGFDIQTPPAVDLNLQNTETLKFGNSIIQIIHTPGHSPGHISIYSRENKFVITGDVLFMGSIGRTDLPGGDYKQLMQSMLGKLIPLGGDVAVYPGHGRSSSIGVEMERNPFIAEVINGEVNF